MEDTPNADPRTTPTGSARKKTGRGVLWAFLAMVIAFGAGFLWQFYEASTVRDQLTAVEQELMIERLRVRLGQATLAAQAGDYEAARQQMSTLFNTMQDQAGALPPEIEAVARDFLARRDDIITGLSRANPAFADVLYGMLERFSTVVERLETQTVPAVQVTEPPTQEEAEPAPDAEPPVPQEDEPNTP